jgi:hypothetical protein
MFIDELERQGVPNIERTIRQGFQTWFRNHVSVHMLKFFGIFSPDSNMCVSCGRS